MAPLASALLAGMAACTAVVTRPSVAGVGVGPAVDPRASRVIRRPSPSRLGDSGPEIDIASFDPRGKRTQILEFASDGQSILYSSSRAPDVGAESAPDLWRYRARRRPSRSSCGGTRSEITRS